METTLHAAVPERDRKPRSGTGWLAGLSLAGSLALPLLVLGVVAPKFKQIFADFGVPLPGLTRLMLALGDVIGTPVGLALGVLLIAVAAVSAGLASRRNTVVLMVVLALAMGVLAVTILTMGVSFYLPLVAMIESMQQGSGGV